MKPPFRIAILETDTPVPKVKELYGSYGDIFERLLKVAADEVKHPGISSKEGLEISKFHVQEKQEYPNIEDIDAILITGSKYDSFADDPWILKLVEFTKKILAQDRVRILGICFGHQIVGRALDVKVGRSDAGWEVAVLPVDLTPKGRELFGKDTIYIHQMHRDIVYEQPKGIELLGSSPRCAVQGLYAKGRLATVQGHPEFTQIITSEIVETRYKQGIFDEEMYKEIMSRVGNVQDGILIAAAFLRFLLED